MNDRDTLYDLLDGLLPEREIVRSDIAGAMVEAIEAAGWRPPAPVVTTAAELKELPHGTVVVDRDGDISVKDVDEGGWRMPLNEDWYTSERLATYAPLTVVYAPTD